ncbi:MAG: hypothetical protein HY482_02570 [Candidatus Wildermuthbacteria bacterium]|nr:hypothetical protein [Candidatus Wildermuthbacteria bacterium]
MFTVALEQKNINREALKHIGGKALPLFELRVYKIPVPKGFAITTKAYGLFLEANGITNDIKKLSQVKSHPAIQKKVAKIRNSILNGNIPKEMEFELHDRLAQYGLKHYVVRSSANVEDAGTKSWAGAFESYLNIPQKDVLSAVKQCWASVFNDRVIHYINNIKRLASIKMAVIVQEYIDSDISGVCFTRNPLDSKDNNILIEAVFGLGELLVQGEIIPDKYKVERESNIILEADVQEQNRATKAAKNSGTKLVSMQKSLKQKLSGRQIIELANIAQKIERIHGKGCDIEWCRKDDVFYIVQSRPITTNRKR